MAVAVVSSVTNMKHAIGQTRNGLPVYVDLISSSAAAQIAARPQLLVLVKEVLAKINVHNAETMIEYDMGRNIGYDFVVPTTEKDVILYAQLMRSDIYTPFVKNGTPQATSYLCFTLKRADDRSYELSDTWVGRQTPSLPGSDHATAESKTYWANHAVVLAAQSIQTRTITRTCPY